MPRIAILLFVLFPFLSGLLVAQTVDEQIDAVLCWAFDQDGIEISDVVASEGGWIVAGRSGSLLAISSDGRKLWESDPAGKLGSNLLHVGKKVYFVALISSGDGGSDEAVLQVFSTQTGLAAGRLELGSGSDWRITESVDGMVLVSGGGKLLAIDVERLHLKWSVDRGLISPFPVRVDSGRVWLFGKDGRPILIDGSVGNEAARFNGFSDPTAAAFIGEMLLVGDAIGEVKAFRNPSGVPSWRFRTGGKITSITGSGENIIAASHDNHVYAFDRLKGSLRWKRRLSGRIMDVQLLQSGYLTAAVLDSRVIEIIDPRSGRVVGQVAVGEGYQPLLSVIGIERGILIVSGSGVLMYTFATCAV
jgi:outer membrane protein assembly factor BamB